LKIERDYKLSQAKETVEHEKALLIKEYQWLREKSQLEIENLKITEIEKMKQELEMLKKTETVRAEMLERLLKEKDAEIQRLSDFIHAGKVPLTFVENTTKKKKERMPYNGEEILVSDNKEEWVLRKFYRFKNNKVETFKITESSFATWDFWKFIDE
jgi:hypothetical protein